MPPSSDSQPFGDATRSERSSSAGKRKRSGRDKNKNSKAKKSKTKRSSICDQFEMRKKKVNALYSRDDCELELPADGDFGGFSSTMREEYARFYSGRSKKTDAALSSSMEEPTMPSVPDPMDDTRIYKYVMVPGRAKKEKKPKKEKRGSASQRQAERPASDSSPPAPPAPPVSVSIPEVPEASFCGLPAEIRFEIYRHLLVANGPVLVRDGWKRIYERDRPLLSKAILFASRQIYSEAICTLYGENTFHYLLRDPVRLPCDVADVEALPYDDRREGDSDYEEDNGYDDDDDDDGSEYEEVAPTRRSVSRRKTSNDGDWDVNINKYGHLIRYLVVEAECNRFSVDTQQTMADAIKVFTPSPAKQDDVVVGPSGANIQTLTIRVAPMNSQTAGFTHVNFFSTKSPVFQALLSSSSQYIHLELLKHAISWSSPGRGSCIQIDMRYYRHYNKMERLHGQGQQAKFNSDIGIVRGRRRKAKETEEFLEQLESRVLAHCNKFASGVDLYEPNEWDYDENGEFIYEI